jgi:hypothetical protein
LSGIIWPTIRLHDGEFGSWSCRPRNSDEEVGEEVGLGAEGVLVELGHAGGAEHVLANPGGSPTHPLIVDSVKSAAGSLGLMLQVLEGREAGANAATGAAGTNDALDRVDREARSASALGHSPGRSTIIAASTSATSMPPPAAARGVAWSQS